MIRVEAVLLNLSHTRQSAKNAVVQPGAVYYRPAGKLQKKCNGHCFRSDDLSGHHAIFFYQERNVIAAIVLLSCANCDPSLSCCTIIL